MTHLDTEDVRLLVVGGGKAGKSLAMNRAEAGWSVAMVERDKIGGTCINVACIPTKALVGSARTLLIAPHAAELGVQLDGEPTISLDALRRHKDSVVGGMVSAHEKMFAESGMDFILGTAHFVAPRTVEIRTRNGDTRRIRGTDVVINTGTTPAVPDLPGIGEAAVWTSETILQLNRLPTRLSILGGGYVGCEFASMFALFGTQVTLVQGRDQLLPRDDPDVAAEVADILTEQGVDLRLGVRTTAGHREPGHGVVTMTLEDGSTVPGEELLVATGRTPVTANLGLESARSSVRRCSATTQARSSPPFRSPCSAACPISGSATPCSPTPPWARASTCSSTPSQTSPSTKPTSPPPTRCRADEPYPCSHPGTDRRRPDWTPRRPWTRVERVEPVPCPAEPGGTA